MRTLTSEEEIALRRIANESIGVDPKLARRLIQLNLAERFRDGWRLTPLGRREYGQLARPPLLLKRHPTYIGRLLDQAIPAARAAAILQPDPVAEVNDGEAGGSTAATEEQAAEIGPSAPVAEQAEYSEHRAACSAALSEFRRSSNQTKIENDRAVADSREALNRSWLLLTSTARMVR